MSPGVFAANNATCCVAECNRKKFKTDDFCALHNEKSQYQTDFHKGLLFSFYVELIDFMSNYIHNLIKDKQLASKDSYLGEKSPSRILCNCHLD